ncbi:proteinase inhibitor I4 serpin [Streptomyces thermolilacinus]|uniref:proteinase inhibitor I4 serpin n=1 Tax=Streptomyces thermolilacinus TaxID=285540 RepID=UPI0033E11C60
MRPTNRTVRAVARLTDRWAATLDNPPATGAGSAETVDTSGGGPAGSVLSAAGLWPLFGHLAHAARPLARTALEDALGMPAEDVAPAARALLTALGAAQGVDAALGLWTRAGLPLHRTWADALPAPARGTLTGAPDADRRALGTWAAERTGGRVPHLPVPGGPDTELVLASALSLRADWFRPFQETYAEVWTGPLGGPDRAVPVPLVVPPGPDRGDRDPGGRGDRRACPRRHGYRRPPAAGRGAHDARAGRLGRYGTAHRPVARGARRPAACPWAPRGPGLTLEAVREPRPAPPQLCLTVPSFDLAAEPDLTAHPEVYGLAAALDGTRGHFPGISPVPLTLEAAARTATAVFGPLGFRAASVTAVSAYAAGVPERRYRSLRLSAGFERPSASWPSTARRGWSSPPAGSRSRCRTRNGTTRRTRRRPGARFGPGRRGPRQARTPARGDRQERVRHAEGRPPGPAAAPCRAVGSDPRKRQNCSAHASILPVS